MSGYGIPGAVGRVLAELTHCCWGAMDRGPTGCTCWSPVYENAALAQLAPKTDTDLVTRSAMCADCAYRPDSPERNGDEAQECSEPGDLDFLAAGDRPFWCHQGMRKVIAWVHPAGIRIESDGDHYLPPVLDGIPYRLSGLPAERCAGWAARKRQLEAQDADL